MKKISSMRKTFLMTTGLRKIQQRAPLLQKMMQQLPLKILSRKIRIRLLLTMARPMIPTRIPMRSMLSIT